MSRFQFRRIGVASEKSGSRPSLHDCIEAVLPLADILMCDVLNGLASVATRTTFNSAFSGPVPLSQAMTDLLCCEASLVTEMFVVQLKLAVYRSNSTEFATSPMPDFADLELLSNEQIDASIEFALALQEVSRGVEDVLPALDALVSSVSGWTTVQPSLNPLKAEVFVQALLACLKQFVSDPGIRAALLIPTAGLLGVNLRQFYLEICDWLRSHGVEPSWPAGSLLSGESTVHGKGRHCSVSRTVTTFDRLRRLLSGGTQLAVGGNGQDFLPTVPFSYVALEELKLIKPMLQRLQKRESQLDEVAVSREEIGEELLVEQARLRGLSRQLGEEVVRLLLDKLAQDDRLLPGVRGLAVELEPALLAIAGSDPRYFADHHHPARQVLDWLICRARCFESDDDPRLDVFLRSVASAIRDLKSPGADSARFAAVLRKLQDRLPSAPTAFASS
ncbi:MAG: DUF1631 family protein [Comamonadaceae bacterium]